ncbi:hypothetical protein AB0L25_18410 [Spirillospora sp. NPDC052242]
MEQFLRPSPTGLEERIPPVVQAIDDVLDRVEQVRLAARIRADESEERRHVQLEVQEGLEAVDLDSRDHVSPFLVA